MALLDIVNFQEPSTIINLVITFILAVCLIVFLTSKTNRKFTLIFFPIVFVLIFTSYILCLDLVYAISLIVLPLLSINSLNSTYFFK